jgi:protein-disulfide isomerase
LKKLLVILAIVGLIGGVWWLTGDKTNAPGEDSKKESANTYGTGSSGVELVEFGDFQCPTCGAFYPIVKEVKEKYKDKITFRFRHFPLQTIHPNARAAHRAGEAASKQGKFWEMHDKLYESQQSWTSSSNPASFFEELATQIGLNLDQFKNDVASSEVNSIINNDVNLGGSLNVSGTPTFFLDGKEVEFIDVNTVEKMSAVLDAAIAAKTGSQPTQ